MEPRFVAYQNAYNAVMNAPNATARVAAEAGLRQAETAVATELGKAWDANITAIQDAKAALLVATLEQARVETEAATAARTRNPTFPVLTVEEMEACQAAAAVTDDARQAVTDATHTFKAGVTVQQLEAQV